MCKIKNVLNENIIKTILLNFSKDAILIDYQINELKSNIALTSNHFKLCILYSVGQDVQKKNMIIKVSDPKSKDIFNFLGFFRAEQIAYDSLLPSQSIIHFPRCFYNYYDENNGNSLLVLEDLSTYKNGNQFKGCSMSVAESVVEQLALFHRYWMDKKATYQNLLPGWGKEQLAFNMRDLKECWPIFTDNFGTSLPQNMHINFEKLLKKYMNIWTDIANGVTSIIHFDLRLDNLFFDNDMLHSIIDWQMTRIGNVSYDLSLFIVGNVNIHSLSDYLELMQIYFRKLNFSNTGYSFKMFLNDFRKSLLCHFCREICYLGCENFSFEQRLKYSKTVFNRYVHSIDYFCTFKLLNNY